MSGKNETGITEPGPRVLLTVWWSAAWRFFIYTIALVTLATLLVSFGFHFILGFSVEVSRNIGGFLGFIAPVFASFAALAKIFSVDYDGFKVCLIKDAGKDGKGAATGKRQGENLYKERSCEKGLAVFRLPAWRHRRPARIWHKIFRNLAGGKNRLSQSVNYFLLPVVIFALISAAGPSCFASDLSLCLDDIAADLVSNYGREFERVSALSILPFHADEKLARRRTGRALAEMLTHSFRKYPQFKIVERLEMENLLEEMKLGMSGVADTKTAVKIGRLSGAKIQVFGSIEKIGAKYHVNARMVETETGNIVSTAYEEVPAGVFEEEAKYYMVPVPETQTLSFYISQNIRKITAREDYTYTTAYSTISASKSR